MRTWCVTWRQWRWLVGLNGAVRQGLDWQQVESALRLMGIKRKRWPDIFAGLRGGHGQQHGAVVLTVQTMFR